MNKYLTPSHLNNPVNSSYHTSRAYEFDTNSSLPNPNAIGEDGIDHINMADDSVTELGRDLCHTAKIGFEHEHYGWFDSVDNFWYYIRSAERDDRLRTFSGRRLKTFSEHVTQCRIPNFRVMVMEANWQKVIQNDTVANRLRASTLPLDCWFRFRRKDGIRMRHNVAHWLIAGFEEIRKALKEDRKPSFDFLRDNDDDNMYATADTVARSVYSSIQDNND